MTNTNARHISVRPSFPQGRGKQRPRRARSPFLFRISGLNSVLVRVVQSYPLLLHVWNPLLLRPAVGQCAMPKEAHSARLMASPESSPVAQASCLHERVAFQLNHEWM